MNNYTTADLGAYLTQAAVIEQDSAARTVYTGALGALEGGTAASVHEYAKGQLWERFDTLTDEQKNALHSVMECAHGALTS